MVAGPQGPQGVTGAQGWQGAQGVQGVQGAQGTQGAQGPQGTQGFQGPQGFPGVQGVQGYQGSRGAQGTALAPDNVAMVPVAVIPVVGLWHTTPDIVGVNSVSFTSKLAATPVGFSQRTTVTRIAIYVATAGTGSNQARLGVYANSPTGPGALVLDAGNVATNALGLREIVLGTPVTLDPGLYWLGYQYQGTGSAPVVSNHPGGMACYLGRATVTGVSVTGAQCDYTGSVPAVGTPLPNPWPASTPATTWVAGNLPIVGLGLH